MSYLQAGFSCLGSGFYSDRAEVQHQLLVFRRWAIVRSANSLQLISGSSFLVVANSAS